MRNGLLATAALQPQAPMEEGIGFSEKRPSLPGYRPSTPHINLLEDRDPIDKRRLNVRRFLIG